MTENKSIEISNTTAIIFILAIISIIVGTVYLAKGLLSYLGV